MTALHFNIWSVIILLGAVQGLFLAGYLFTKKENRAANKWLAFLLTVISLHLFEYAAAITGLTLEYPVLIAVTYPLLFCIGPLYFIYSHYLLDRNYKAGFKSILHFIPSLVILLMMLPFYTMAPETKVKSILQLSQDGSLKIPAEQLLIMAAHVIQTAIYIYAVHKFCAKKEEQIKQHSADVYVIRKLGWLKRFSLFLGVYFFVYFIIAAVLTIIDSYQVELDYVLLLIMSISVYAIGYSAISNPEIFKAIPPPVPVPLPEEIIVRSNLPQNGSKSPGLKEKLLHYMESDKPYLKSELKISEVADALKVPYYQLSQLINEEFLVNFFDFINKYRVEEAKTMLVEDSRNYKILAIAYEVGFNSKATFNRVFKKITGLTPSAYKDKFSQPPGASLTSSL